MNAKCYLLLTIVSALPLVRDSVGAENLTSRPHPSLDAVTSYPRGEPAPLPGIVRPIRQVTMAAPVEGMLMLMQVQEGQSVREGDVLAVIDNRVAQAAVDVAEAVADRSGDLRHAREEAKFAESLLERLLALKSANGGSDFELLEARTRVEQAHATIASREELSCQANRQLELERARLEAHNIRAPFDGEIVRIHAYPGTTLTRDDQLLTIVRLEELEVELHVPLALYERLEPQQTYSLIAGPPLNCRVQGRLAFVAPLVDSATQTFRSVFVLDNRDQNMPAGFSVQLDMESLQK